MPIGPIRPSTISPNSAHLIFEPSKLSTIGPDSGQAGQLPTPRNPQKTHEQKEGSQSQSVKVHPFMISTDANSQGPTDGSIDSVSISTMPTV